MSATVLMWFRNDLRLSDNPALHAAAATVAPVVPVFILDDDAPGDWRAGGASRWWLDGSLAVLQRQLEAIGSRLILARGPTRDVLLRLARETEAQAVYCARAYEPWASRLEARLKPDLDDIGVDLKRHRGALLFEPESLRTQQGAFFKVYTPFSRAALADGETGAVLAPPRTLMAPDRWPKSDALPDWNLTPTKPDWAGGLRAAWQPGEPAARDRLSAFIADDIANYHDERNRPDHSGTSRLSPYLHHGEISIRQCWQSARTVAAADPASSRGAEVFVKELLWREFSYHLLVNTPSLPDAPFREQFAHFPWAPNREHLERWQRGQTGYPIVDAGMRELWTTGWMHNRVRMITASFLIKHLLQPWQSGEAWFWDTLVDADLAANAASWQWVAGSGVDAAPYFRIFNPVKQGETFDPEGDYVRKWCPELSQMPAPEIHAPWAASAETLASAGVVLGRTYPLPIVDHKTARARALAAFEAIKTAS